MPEKPKAPRPYAVIVTPPKKRIPPDPLQCPRLAWFFGLGRPRTPLTLSTIEWHRRIEAALDGRGFLLMRAFVYGERGDRQVLRLEYNRFRHSWDQPCSTPHIVVRFDDLRALRADPHKVPLSTWGDRRVTADIARGIARRHGLPISDDADALRTVEALAQSVAYDREHPTTAAPMEALAPWIADDHAIILPTPDVRAELETLRADKRRLERSELRVAIRTTFRGQAMLDHWRGDAHHGVNPKWYAKVAPLLDLGDGSTSARRVQQLVLAGTSHRVRLVDIEALVARMGGAFTVKWFGSYQGAAFWNALEMHIRQRAWYEESA